MSRLTANQSSGALSVSRTPTLLGGDDVEHVDVPLQEKNEKVSDPKALPDQSESSTDPGQSKDIHIVDWDGPDDLENPLNWKHSQRILHVLFASAFVFYAYVLPAIPFLVGPFPDCNH